MKDLKPVWENKQNKGGGKFIIRIKKENSDYVWEKILFSVLNWDEKVFCGVVVIAKKTEIVISIWTKELDNHLQKIEIKKFLRSILSIDEAVYIEYKEHPYTDDMGCMDYDWEHIVQVSQNKTLNLV